MRRPAEPALLVLGGGNMGSALIRGALRAGVLPPSRLLAVDPDPARRKEIEALGVRTLGEAAEALPWLDEAGPGAQLLLAIKPQFLPGLAASIAGQVAERVVITILAGTPSQRVRNLIGSPVRVILAMPNLPASIGKGVTALCSGSGALPGDDSLATRLFDGVGAVIRIDEPLMDAFTALAGSGPAYLFYLAEAMQEAAIKMGFDGATAAAATRHTLLGAASLLAAGVQAPESLRAAVTSKGGTTAAATAVLDDRHVKEHIVQAILAARQRGRELAQA